MLFASQSWTFIVSIISYILISGSTIEARRPLQAPKVKLNYGVIFRELDNFYVAAENLVHVFSIELPAQTTIPTNNDNHCEDGSGGRRRSAMCLRLQPVVNQTHQMYTEAAQKVQTLLRNVYKLIPHIQETSTGITRRTAILGFLAPAFQSIFGLASDEESQAMKTGIDALQKQIRQAIGEVRRTAHEQATYQQTLSHRHEGVSNILRLQQQSLHQLSTQFHSAAVHADAVTHLLATGMEKLFQFQLATLEIERLQRGLYAALSGSLTPDLLSPDTLNATLEGIKRRLATTRPNLTIVRPFVQDFYQRHDFAITRHGTNIYITIKIPLAAIDNPLTLFAVETHPVPLPNGDHISQLINVPPYIAFYDDSQHYMQFTARPQLKPPHLLYLSRSSSTLKPINQPACLLSLMLDASDHVKKLCTFAVKFGFLQPNIVFVDLSTVVLVNTSQVTFQCGRQSNITIQGCSYCILDIPCNCALISDSAYIPRRIGGTCRTNSTEITRKHGYNLALLQAFFDSSKIRSLSGGQLLQQELDVVVPAFNILLVNTTKQLANLETQDYDLKKLAEHAINNSPIFASAEHAIRSDMQTLQTTIFQPDFWHTFLFYLFGACATSALILVILLGARVKYLAAAMMMAKAPAQAIAITIKPLDFFATTPFSTPNVTRFQPTVTDLQSIPTFLYHYQYSTLTLLVFAILLIVCSLRQNQNLINTKFTIELHLGNQTQLVKLTIMTMQHAVCSYKFQADSFIQSMHVSGHILPSLHLFWPTLLITHRLTKQTYTLPQSVHISPFLAFKIRKLTLHPYWLLLVTNDSRNLAILPLQGTIWDSKIDVNQREMNTSSSMSCPTLNSITGSQEEIV